MRSRSEEPRRPRRHWWLMLPFLLVAVIAARPVLGSWVADALIESEAPRPADVAIVLGGDYTGSRIVRGAELLRDGFAPVALVSGQHGFFGTTESELAIAWAVRQGLPASLFESFPNHARSTSEEAAAFAPELRRRGVKRVLLVTTPFHSARAARIFRAAMPDIEIIPVITPRELGFDQGQWWKYREGQKAVFYEVTKVIASFLGM